MSIFIAAAIEIGAIAAKSICRLWLKGTTGGDDLSFDLIDIFKEKTSNALVQRQGRRFFERIGDKICDEILPLLEEGVHLDEGERNAIALAVEEAFNKTRLTNEILFKYNLQPIELKKHILASHTPMKREDFSRDALYLYDRMITEVCTYIIDIWTQLPGFTEHTFIEILQREDRIMDRIDQVLLELRRMREEGTTIGKADRFEKDYRDAVARNLDVVQLIGVDVSLPHRRHQLSVAYISLSVLQQRLRRSDPSISFSKMSMNEPERAIASVETILASSQRLLLLGPAGSGKTTLLQWIAVRAATRTFTDSLKEWSACLPFYIRLRRYASSDLPQPAEFPAFAARAIIGEMPPEWVHTILRSGRAILLIDGVDEIATSRREDVHTWLRDLVETYHNCRFIVTSRPHAIEAGWMNRNPFDTAVLQEMTLADIDSFIDHWHEAVKQELPTEEETSELPLLADHLKAHIRQTRTLRHLATTPLLCAMLCALHRERRRHLPVNRIEIYQACCALLLERREKDRHIDLSDYPILTYSQKERLLSDMANWMARKNLSETDVSEVDASFTRSLANMPNVAQETTGKAVRRLLVERSGIIREPVAGKIDFVHRTFQEFFTALASINSIKYLINHAHLDQWREVILLTAGLVRKAQGEQLIKGLLRRGDQEEAYRYQLHLLAVSCLETVVELGEATRKDIEQRFRLLIPPKNMHEARVLAAARDLAIPHLDFKALTKTGKLFVSTCAACVHTLALIGGDAALGMLEEYAHDSRKMVIDQLVASWERFEPDSYAKRVVARVCEGKTSLQLTQRATLDGIQHIPHLTKLDLSGTQISDLSPLASLPHLTELGLSGTQISDLSPLASLPHLTKLDLSGTQIRDLSPLVSLPHLTKLDLSRTQIHDLSILASLPHLTEVDLGGTQIHDLSPLVSLPHLTGLGLSGMQISDLSPLADFSHLIWLDLSGTHVSDLAPLTRLPDLIEVDLSNTQISDLTPLASLPNLTRLGLVNTPIRDLNLLASFPRLTGVGLNRTQISDFSPLASLPYLIELYLPSTQISDLSPLADLLNLTTLDLSETRIRDLSPLSGLSHLTRLDLGGTRIRDLSPLANLLSLTTLDLSNTQISDLTPLANLFNLTTLYLPGTRISDLTPLAGLTKLEQMSW